MILFVGIGLLILGLVLLVSAPGIPSDTGSNATINGSDGTIFNITATPHRQKDNGSIGYTEVNITTDRDVNKSFTLSNGSGESYIDLLNNHSVSLNTTCFNVPDNGLNKSYSLIDNNGSNVSLNVEFDKLFNPLGDVLPSLQNEVTVNGNIQAAVDQASNGDTVVIPYKAGGYTGAGNKNVNITNKNLTIMGSGGDVVIDGEGNGRIFNITDSSVNITGLKIQNTNINDYGGAVYCYNGVGSVNGCTFTNTRSSSGSGGAVYFYNGGSVNGCTFTNTSSSGGSFNYGGAVYINGGGSVNGCTFTNTSSSGGSINYGGAVYFIGGGSVNGSTFTNTSSSSNGGAVYFISGVGSVNGSTFTNTSSSGSGGAVYFYNGVGSVNGCSIVNCTAASGGVGIHVNSGTRNVSYNRFVNNTVNGVLSNVNGFSGDRDSNWWGTNNINDAGIGGSLPNNYYQIELSAANESTRDVNKTIGSFILPVPLGYKMCLNGTNNTGNISNLPDFNATIKLIDSLRSNGNFRSSLDLFRVSPFQMTPGDSVNVSAKNSWVE
ncbi:MAG: conserved hypothetical protein [Methanobrevibacter sp. CfCl-M3]